MANSSGMIFISYSRADLESVRPIVAEIRKSTGIDPWIDYTGIETGSQFEDVIIEAIDQCKVFVFIMSKKSLDSLWTRREVDYAFNIHKKVCPVRIDGTRPAKWFLFKYGGIDSIDYADITQRQKLFRNLREWASAYSEKSDDELCNATGDGVAEGIENELPRTNNEIASELKSKPAQMGQPKLLLKALSKEVERFKTMFGAQFRSRTAGMSCTSEDENVALAIALAVG